MEFPSRIPMLDHHPGGKVSPSVKRGVRATAEFLADHRNRMVYRPWLTRAWDEKPDEQIPHVLFIGMNPSVASETVDDPTIIREVGFARRLGFSRYVKANVMDYRATNPATLLALEEDPDSSPRSPVNMERISMLARTAGTVICAWGVVHPKLRHYADQTESMLRDLRMDIYCLGLTQGGMPRHPLYLPSDAPLIPFPASRRA